MGVGLTTPTPTMTPTPTPVATPTPIVAKFPLLPTGVTLPGDDFCAIAVAGDLYEPRPDNVVANATIPSGMFLTTYRTAVANGEGGAQGSYLQRVSGAFSGNTDAILKWASCKWGF